jgi:hypothetical protein
MKWCQRLRVYIKHRLKKTKPTFGGILPKVTTPEFKWDTNWADKAFNQPKNPLHGGVNRPPVLDWFNLTD